MWKPLSASDAAPGYVTFLPQCKLLGLSVVVQGNKVYILYLFITWVYFRHVLIVFHQRWHWHQHVQRPSACVLAL